MIGAGLLGGIANFLNGDLLEKSPSRGPWRTFFACITYGLIASGVVPLFLTTIHSDLLKETNLNTTTYLEFSGFCLLAALFSRKFLESVADRALKIAENAKKQSESTATEFREVMGEDSGGDDDDTEGGITENSPGKAVGTPAQTAEGAPGDLTAAAPHGSGISGATGDGIKLLKILATGTYLFRSVAGLKKQIGWPENVITGHLGSMKHAGLVNQTNRSGRWLWYITARGRNTIGSGPPPRNLTAEPE
jgi:hypothetical protein